MCTASGDRPGYNNALVETINGYTKPKLSIKGACGKALEEVEYATLEWVDWFGHCRLLEPIGNIPLAEYEILYYEQNE